MSQPGPTHHVSRLNLFAYATPCAGSRYQLGNPDRDFKAELEALDLYNEDDPLAALLPLTEMPAAPE